MSDDSMSRAHAIKGQSMVDRRGLDGELVEECEMEREERLVGCRSREETKEVDVDD